MDKKEEEILQNTEGYQQYEESFIVGQYECDCNGRLKREHWCPSVRQSAPTTVTRSE